MKNFCFVLLLLLSMQSCFDFSRDDSRSTDPVIYSKYEPVFMERSTFEESIKYLNSPQSFVETDDKKGEFYTKVGKIYSYPPFIFINQLNKGFHVVDNSDPKNPKKIGFLEAPGSTDLVIKNNVILLNHATDLVSISFTNNQFKVEKRLKQIFPSLKSPDNFYQESPKNKVIVGFKNKKS